MSDAPLAPLIIGLTGGIGSGKSTVAELFQRFGARIIDTDQISHQLTQANGAALPTIQHAFGADFITPEHGLDRAKMRAHIFNAPAEKKRLEAILHPAIFQCVDDLLSQPCNAPYTVLVVPLLFETGHYTRLCQRIVVVDCPEPLQIARTMARSQLERAQVEAIMRQQLPRTTRLARANDVINNESGLVELNAQVAALHQNYLALGRRSN